jgi:hypothetical protein
MHKSWAIIFFMSFFGLHLGSSLDWETDGCSFVHSSPQHWACPVHEDEMDFVLSTCLRSKPTWLLVTAVLVITSDYLAKASPLFPTYLLAFISRRISRTTSRNARCAPREFHFRPCCCSNPSCFEHEKGNPAVPSLGCQVASLEVHQKACSYHAEPKKKSKKNNGNFLWEWGDYK